MRSSAAEVAGRFGENLIRCRTKAGLSERELAHRAKLKCDQIWAFERGRSLPRTDTLVRLAGSLDVTPNDLLEGIDWHPAETLAGEFYEMAVPGLGSVQRRVEVERKS